MKLMNKEQQRALKNIYDRVTPGGENPISYLAFRRTANYSHLMGCFMVEWCGMIIGIEEDGYTHS